MRQRCEEAEDRGTERDSGRTAAIDEPGDNGQMESAAADVKRAGRRMLNGPGGNDQTGSGGAS